MLSYVTIDVVEKCISNFFYIIDQCYITIDYWMNLNIFYTKLIVADLPYSYH